MKTLEGNGIFPLKSKNGSSSKRISVFLLTVVLLSASIFVAMDVQENFEGTLDDTFTVDGIAYQVTSESPMTVAVVPAVPSYSGDIVILATVTHDGDIYSVTSIGDNAFKDCWSLYSIDIGSVTSIGDNAFESCINLLAIDLGSVTSIGDSAFYGCSGINQQLVIPPTVKSIGDKAFLGCILLTGVTEIPSSVTSIGDNPFAGCQRITGFTVSGGTNYSAEDGVLYNGDKTRLVAYPIDNGTTYVIPSSVESIGSYAFYNCKNLTDVTIPSSVTSIGDYAFSNCSTLNNVIMPSSVRSIGDHAFSNCIKFTSITIPPLVGSIGDYAFQYCTGLTSVDLASVTSIGDYAFNSCTELTSVDLASVTSIGDYAFSDCSKLIGMLEMPLVTSIGNDAFSGCTELAGTPEIPLVTSIGNDAFSGCTELAGILEMPLVTFIGNNAFSDCSKLTGVNLDLVGSIGDYAFYNCTGLTGTLEIPSTVTSIGAGAFQGCANLMAFDVSVNNQNYSSDGGVLYNKVKSTLVAYPMGKQGSFLTPASVESIDSSAFYGCTGLTGIDLASVTSIGDYAFYGCTGLTSIMLPSSVESIGRFAFIFCTELDMITLSSDTTLGAMAFMGVSSDAVFIYYTGTGVERMDASADTNGTISVEIIITAAKRVVDLSVTDSNLDPIDGVTGSGTAWSFPANGVKTFFIDVTTDDVYTVSYTPSSDKYDVIATVPDLDFGSKVPVGTDFTFTVSLKPDAVGDFEVKANGSVVDLVNGVYTVSGTAGQEIIITVSEVQEPSGSDVNIVLYIWITVVIIALITAYVMMQRKD